MPPVDLDTFLCGVGDSKVACETHISAAADLPSGKPDAPPLSLPVPFRTELRWVKVLDRGESTIGNANPKSNRSGSKPNSGPRRLAAGVGAMKPNGGPIIAVPIKSKHSILPGNTVRPVTNFRFFPNKNTIVGDRMQAVPDPVSPKVSCFGSALSRNKNDPSQRKSQPSVTDVEVQLKGARCLASLAEVFRYRVGYPSVSAEVESDGSTNSSINDSAMEWKLPADVLDDKAPDLQAMKRFSSGRQSDWRSDDVYGADGGCVVSLEPLAREGVLGRR